MFLMSPASINYKETLTQHRLLTSIIHHEAITALENTHAPMNECMQTCTCSYLELHRCLSTLCHSSLVQFSPLLQRAGSQKCQCNHSQLPPSAKGQIKNEDLFIFEWYRSCTNKICQLLQKKISSWKLLLRLLPIVMFLLTILVRHENLHHILD